MRSSNTFGVHFVLRRMAKTHSIFARITVNGTRCELGLKRTIDPGDWNVAKGVAKPKNPALKQLNSLLEEVRAKLVSNYQQLNLSGEYFSAEMLKHAYLGKTVEGEKKMTLNQLVAMDNEMLGKALEPGTMKNYKSTCE